MCFELNNQDKYVIFVIYYFNLRNSAFYKKYQLDKYIPFLNLNNDIAHSMQKGEIVLLDDFNAQTSYKQSIVTNCLNNFNSL